MATNTQATVHDIKALSGDVWQVRLKPIEPYPYAAGQYTELVIDGFEFLFFTIASAPHSPCIELHIQCGSDTNNRLIKHLQQTDAVALAPAAGRCVLTSLPDSEEPLLLIASGTGFSQVKAIVEDLLHQNSQRPTYIYWTSYKLSQLYMLEKAELWAEQNAHIHTAMLISEQGHWQDKNQMLVHSILADHEDIAQCHAVTCGSPEMVYTVLDTLCEHGFQPQHMISDVFEIAPRESQ
ncbi:MAG: NAD(P)H-flavin reductase [Reinekea sp.]|nr:NAD(P)H-flavin reductase [Reinekea sp.]